MEVFLSILAAISAIEYGIYIAIGLIVFLVSAILSIFLISIFTKTHFSIGFGFFKIAFGNKYNAVNKVGLITSLMEYQESHIRQIMKIETSTIKRQISQTEQKLQTVKFILANNYLELLSDKLEEGEDAKSHKEFKAYQVIIGILMRELIDEVFQESFLENHFDEMSEIGWKIFISDKGIYILNFISDYLDNMYNGSDKCVTREDAYESELKLYPQIKEVVSAIYSNVKDISIQSKLELQKEREHSKEVVKDICKNNGFALEEK